MSNGDQARIRCPYCGERIEVQADIGGDEAEYVEDCSVCCRPILLRVTRDEDGRLSVSAIRETE